MILMLHSSLKLSDQAAGSLLRLPSSPGSAHPATIEHSSPFCRLILVDIFVRYNFITYKSFHLSLDFSKHLPHSTPFITKIYD
jgi:hypothetical protein